MATKAKKAVPEGLHTVTPSLVIDGAAEAIDWYVKALGAEERMRMPGPGGKIMHGEVRIGDSVLFINDPMMDAKSPKQLGGTPVTLSLYVEDVDALWSRAVKAGATVKMPPTDMFWGDRWAALADPFGHSWGIATHKEDLTHEEMRQRQQEWEKQMAQQQKK
jgi:uncharacterized glyoxalase superfamily protein PhnB